MSVVKIRLYRKHLQKKYCIYLVNMASLSVFYPWTDKMSVQSEEIDLQHKQLIDIINELYQAFMNKEHKEKISVIINRLEEYAKYHFSTEEKYFDMFDFYDKENHIKEHHNFKEKVNEFIQKYQKKNDALTYNVMLFLKNWLNGHIMGTDRKYIECFIKHGVK